MSYGWAGKILRIDLTNRKNSTEDIKPYVKKFVGGKGINTKIIFDEIDKSVHPFDPENILCIGTGVLSGTPAPSASRSTLSALSPRGLLDSSGIGGFIGAEMKFAGYDHFVIKGRADQPVYLYINNDGVEIRPADHIWGKDPWETQTAIREELHDKDIQALSIGIAGENRIHFACVITGKLQSAAGRCGMGAIMGAKNLKAIAVRGTGPIAVAHPEKYLASCLAIQRDIRGSESFHYRRTCGVDKYYYKSYLEVGKLVTGNWEHSRWSNDGFFNLLAGGEQFWEKEAQHLQPKGARQPGCFGCPMYHETYFKVPEYNDINRTKCVEWLIGPMLWLTDRKDVIHAAYLCNKFGLDAISTANCIAFLMELYHNGIINDSATDGISMKRGDLTAIDIAIEKIAKAEGFGKLFQKGVAGGAAEIGKGLEQYAMQIKGLELMPIEMRLFKSIALLSSTTKVEHLSMIDYYWPQNSLSMEKLAEASFGKKNIAVSNTYEEKALLAVDSENRHCMGDITGVCKTLIPWGHTQSFKEFVQLVCLATGMKYDEAVIRNAADRTFLLERAFNALMGIRRIHERPPMRLFERPVSDGKFKGEVLDPEQFENMLDEYYRLRGCDAQGVPTPGVFAALDLRAEWKRYNKRFLSKD